MLLFMFGIYEISDDEPEHFSWELGQPDNQVIPEIYYPTDDEVYQSEILIPCDLSPHQETC